MIKVEEYKQEASLVSDLGQSSESELKLKWYVEHQQLTAVICTPYDNSIDSYEKALREISGKEIAGSSDGFNDILESDIKILLCSSKGENVYQECDIYSSGCTYHIFECNIQNGDVILIPVTDSHMKGVSHSIKQQLTYYVREAYDTFETGFWLWKRLNKKKIGYYSLRFGQSNFSIPKKAYYAEVAGVEWEVSNELITKTSYIKSEAEPIIKSKLVGCEVIRGESSYE